MANFINCYDTSITKLVVYKFLSGNDCIIKSDPVYLAKHFCEHAQKKLTLFSANFF